LSLSRGALIDERCAWPDREVSPECDNKEHSPSCVLQAFALGVGKFTIAVVVCTRCRRQRGVKRTQTGLNDPVGDVPNNRKKYEGHSRDKEPVTGNVCRETFEYRQNAGFGDAKQKRV